MADKVSVIVCTYNRLKYLKTCLDQLALQKISPQAYEVIIVNNNSPDKTEEFCREFIDTHADIDIKYFNETNQGHTYSRNRGIQESSGEILAFIDDDAFVSPDYVKSILNFFNKHKAVKAIGGKIMPVFESQKPLWMSKYLMPLVSALDLGNSEVIFKGRKHPVGANMAFRKEVFQEYGMFDVELGRRGTTGLEGGDEKEVFLRLKKAGEKIYYVPDMKVDHIIPDKRIQPDYIKGLATGVGTSERKRIIQSGTKEILNKVGEEAFKSAATLVLLFFYCIRMQPSKGWMLLKFRFWVIKGLFRG